MVRETERGRERGGEKTAGSAEQGGCGFWVGHNSSDCIFSLSISRSLAPSLRMHSQVFSSVNKTQSICLWENEWERETKREREETREKERGNQREREEERERKREGARERRRGRGDEIDWCNKFNEKRGRGKERGKQQQDQQSCGFWIGHNFSNCVFSLSRSLVLLLPHSICTFQSLRP